MELELALLGLPLPKHPTRSFEDLPRDIVYYIFLKLPVKSLLQFRRVSKPWCNIIDDPCLATRIQLVTSPIPMSETDVEETWHLVEKDGRDLRLTNTVIAKISESGSYGLKGSCNGLLCFFNKPLFKKLYEELIFLCNPLGREILTLPPLNTVYIASFCHCIGLGFSPSTKEYKVVRVFIRKFKMAGPSFTLGAQIYTLGTKSWRDMTKVPPYPLCEKAVYANGTLHWRIDTYFSRNKARQLMVTFNIETEEFSMIAYPDLVHEINNAMHLIEVRGCLSLVDCSSTTHIDIWVLTDYSKKQWVREYRISKNGLDGSLNSIHVRVVCLWKHGEILLSSSKNRLLCYNRYTGDLSRVDIPGLSNLRIYGFRGSLVSLKDYDNRTQELSLLAIYRSLGYRL